MEKEEAKKPGTKIEKISEFYSIEHINDAGREFRFHFVIKSSWGEPEMEISESGLFSNNGDKDSEYMKALLIVQQKALEIFEERKNSFRKFKEV